MSTKLDLVVRRQQLILLRFEKYLRTVAPLAISIGLSSAAITEGKNYINDISSARANFTSAMSLDHNASTFLLDVQAELASKFDLLTSSDTLEARQGIMLDLMAAVDRGHKAAESSAMSRGIRLIGQKFADGLLVDGGTPKLENFGWLTSQLNFS